MNLDNVSPDVLQGMAQSLGLNNPEPKKQLGTLGRIGAATLNLPSNISSAVGDTAANLFADPVDYIHQGVPKVIDTENNYAAPEGFLQKAVNFLGEGLVPNAIAFAGSHAIGEGFLGDLGLGARAASALSGAVSGAATSGQPEGMVQGAIQGGVLTGLNNLTPIQKLSAVTAGYGTNVVYDAATSDKTLGQSATSPDSLGMLGMAYAPELLTRSINKLAGRGFTDPSMRQANAGQVATLQQPPRLSEVPIPPSDLNAELLMTGDAFSNLPRQNSAELLRQDLAKREQFGQLASERTAQEQEIQPPDVNDLLGIQPSEKSAAKSAKTLIQTLPDVQKAAQYMGINYDGYSPGTGLHSFTDPNMGKLMRQKGIDPGLAEEASFSIPSSDLTPEAIRSKLGDLRNQFLNPDVPEGYTTEQGTRVAKGTLSELPEYMRTQGGYVASDAALKVLNNVGAPVLQGFAGSIIGSQIGDTDEERHQNALLGLGLGVAAGVGTNIWRSLGEKPTGTKLIEAKVRGKDYGQISLKDERYGDTFDFLVSENASKGQISDVGHGIEKSYRVSYLENGEPIEHQGFNTLDEAKAYAQKESLKTQTLGHKLVKDDFAEPVATLQKEDGKLPDWAKERMVEQGLDSNRTFNDVDLRNKSVRDAIKSDPTLSEEQKTQILKTGSFKPTQMKLGKGDSNINGSISAPLAMSLGRASVGALAGGTVGYKESDGDWGATLGGALLGAGMAEIGGRVIGGFLNTTPKAELVAKGENSIKATVKSEADALKQITSTPLVDIAGQAIDNRGTFAGKLARATEVLTNWHIPEAWKTAMTQAGGKVEAISKQVNDAFKDAKNYIPTSDTLERVGKYFKGNLTDPAEVLKLASSEGGMNHNDWLQSTKDQRQGLNSYWSLGEPIGDAQKDNANLLHVTKDTRDKLVQMENANLVKGLQGSDLAFAKSMQIARFGMNSLQQMIHDALPASRIASVINNSLDQYVTRRYSFFKEGIQPTDAQVEASAKQWGFKSGLAILQEAKEKGLASTPAEHAEMLQSNPQGFGPAFKKASQELDSWLPVQHTRLIAPGSDATITENWMVHPDVMDKYKLNMDNDLLKSHIQQYLSRSAEGKQLYGMNATSSGLDVSVLKEREMLTPTFRELLGEYKDPVEGIAHALGAILPAARQAEMISSLKELPTKSGMPSYFENKEDWVRVKQAVQNQIDQEVKAGNFNKVATLQSKLNDLLSYRETGPNLKYGILKDGLISRGLSDSINGLQGGIGDFEHAVSRNWIQQINRYTKAIHSPYNPAMQLRWLFQTPLFMAIARVSPSRGLEAFMDVEKQMWTGKTSQNLTEFIKSGLAEGTYATQEMGLNFGKIVNGESETNLLGKIHQKVLEHYNTSDLATRMASYFSAKDRLAAKLGVGLDHPDVIRGAIEHTNRYTLDYGSVAPVVRLARNIPMFNLYASYAAEIVRIAKNLGEDALFHSDTSQKLHAITMLGTIGILPEAMQRLSVANLSTKDQKEWEQSQKMVPDYSRNRYKFVFGKDSKGNFNYLDYTSLVPHGDWGESIRAIASGDLKSLAAVNPVVSFDNSPALNMLAQQIAGKDFHNDRDFRGFKDRVIATAKDLTPALTPGIGYDFENWRNVGVTNQKTGRTSTIEGMVLKTITGLNETSINPAIVNKSAVNEFQDKLHLEQQYLYDTLKTTMPQDRKDRAVRIYQDAVASLIANYRNKMVQ